MGNPINAATLARIATAGRAAVAEPLARRMRGPETLTPEQHDAITRVVSDQFTALIRTIWKQGTIAQYPFTVGTAAVRLRPAEPRQYVFLQNQSGANQMALGIGKPPSAVGVTPVDGLVIGINLSFYEPILVPQDELWIVAAGAGTPGLLLIGTLA